MAVHSNITPFFQCTLGPSDIFYLPSGWTFFEKIVGNADFAGLKMSAPSVADLPNLSALSRYLVSAESPSAPLQNIVDCLTLASS